MNQTQSYLSTRIFIFCSLFNLFTPIQAAGLWDVDSLKPKYLYLHSTDSLKNLALKGSLADSIQQLNLSSKQEYRHVLYAQALMKFDFQKQFFFKTAVRVATEWTSISTPLHPYEPYLGLAYNPQKVDSTGGMNKRTWDFLATHAYWDLPWIRLGMAYDWIQTGPSIRNHLMWSGAQNTHYLWRQNQRKLPQSAPILHFYWDLPFKNLRYRQWSGTLQSKKELAKYVHSQRLDIQSTYLDFGLTQSVSYGSLLPGVDSLEAPYPQDLRTMQWAYTLPFIPYYFTQHQLGDRDNSLMSFDLNTHWQDQRIYGELLLDDLKSPTALLKDDWWGNKFGAIWGIELNYAKFTQDFKFNYEWTHIEPWVYTHRYGRGLNWEHYGHSLGAELGPNSKEHWLQLSWIKPHCHQLDLYYLWTAKGYDLGSAITDLHKLTDRTDKTYLNPDSSFTYGEMGLRLRKTLWSDNLYAQGALSRYWGDYHGYAIQTLIEYGF